MKKVVFLVIIIMCSLLGAYTQWEDNGLAIRKESNMYYPKTVIKLSDSSRIMIWSDAANGYQQIKAIKTDSNGNHIWSPEGNIIVDNQIMPYNFEIIESNDNSVIIFWEEDWSNSDNRLICQKISADGEVLWQPQGITLFIKQYNGIDYSVCTDGSDGFFATWLDHQNGQYQMIVQHLDGSGDIHEGFSDYGNSIASSQVISYPVCTYAGDGNTLCSWKTSNYYEGDIYLQKVSSDGSLLWQDQGIIIDYDEQVSQYQKVCIDNEENIYVSALNYVEDGYSLHLQKLSPEGIHLWENPLTINEYIIASNYEACLDNDNNLIFRTIADSSHLKVQKVTPEGELLWNDSTIEFSTDYHSVTPASALDDAGNLWMIWRECDGIQTSLFVQKFNNAGMPVFDEGTTLICDEEYFRTYPSLIAEEDGEMSAYWRDLRNSRDALYTQKFSMNGTPQFQQNGMSLYDCVGGQTDDMQSCASENYTALVWADDRYNEQKTIYMQVVDNNTGEILLEENGISVIDYSSDRYCNFDCAYSEEDETIGIIWYEFSEDGLFCRIQIVDIYGNRLLGSNGEAYFEDTSNEPVLMCGSPQITYYNGGFNICFGYNCEFMSMDYEIFAQRYENLQPQWGEGISIIDNFASNNSLNFCSINENLIIWADDYTNLRAQKIDVNGEKLWDEEGVLIASSQTDWLYSNHTIITENGVFVFWGTGSSSEYETFVQLINPDGEIGFDLEGLKVAEFNGFSNTFTAFANEESFFVAFGNDSYLYLKKYDYMGNLTWETQYTPINNYCSVSGIDVVEDLISVYYASAPGDANIYGVFFDDDGDIYPNTPENGFTVCDAINSQGMKGLHNIEASNQIITWTDQRSRGIEQTSDPSIYIQKIELPIIVDINDNEIVEFNNLRNYPNPFRNSTRISCETSRNMEEVNIEIYNLKGQLVRRIATSDNSTDWDCRDSRGNTVGTGVYFYRIVSDSYSSKSQKMILVK